MIPLRHLKTSVSKLLPVCIALGMSVVSIPLAMAQYSYSPYMKCLETASAVHTMGKSIPDGAGIRFGGFTNASSDTATQEMHQIEIFEYPHPGNPLVTVRIIRDTKWSGAIGSSTIISQEACGSYLNYPTNGDFLHGYLPYTDIAPYIDSTDLVSTAGGYDYDMFMVQTNDDLDLIRGNLFGTECMEQDPFYIETPEQTLDQASNSSYFLGASRSLVYSAPTDLVISNITPTHGINWMKTYGVNSHNPLHPSIFSEQLVNLLGISNGNVLATFIFRGQAVPGCHLMLDDQGDFVWANAYSFDGEATLINSTVEDPDTPDTLAILGHILVAPYMSKLDIGFARFGPADPITQIPGIEAEIAYQSVGNTHYLYPYQMVQSENDYIICGSAENISTHEPISIVFKVDGNDGTIVWQNCFNIGDRSEALSLTVNADGTVWVAGNTNLEQNTPFTSWKNFYLAELDGTNGQIRQARYYDEDNYQFCVDLLAPQTGEHVLDGYHYVSSITFQRFFVKTDPLGIGPVCSSIPVEPSDEGEILETYSAPLDVDPFDDSDIDITPLSPYSQSLQMTTTDMGCTDCNCE